MDSERRNSPAAVIVNWHSAFSAGDIDAALDQHAGDVELVDLAAERLVRGLLFDQLGVPVPPAFGTGAVTTPPR